MFFTFRHHCIIINIKCSLGQDACQGDSGGPMVIRDTSDDPWYQIGLVSFGLEAICGGAKNREKKPGVFTKVVNYLPWIESKLQD